MFDVLVVKRGGPSNALRRRRAHVLLSDADGTERAALARRMPPRRWRVTLGALCRGSAGQIGSTSLTSSTIRMTAVRTIPTEGMQRGQEEASSEIQQPRATKARARSTRSSCMMTRRVVPMVMKKWRSLATALDRRGATTSAPRMPTAMHLA